MRARHRHVPLALMTALLVLLVAIMAGASLSHLRRMHNQVAHAAAAKSVLDQGRRIVAYLAQQPAVRNGGEESWWGQFSRVVCSIHTIEDGLQYVSVTKDGITVFDEHTRALDGSGGLCAIPPIAGVPDGEIEVNRKVLTLGSNTVPVVTFTRNLTGEDGGKRTIEVALRKDAVNREEGTMSDAIDSMFKVSLLTMVVSFLVCVVVVVVMMRREAARERRMREEEHLVFAGVMANGIVHDFRNPMSSMKLDLQMLQKEASRKDDLRAGRLTELSDRIQATMLRMDKVFQEFFYLSKPEVEKEELIDLSSLIRECVNIMAPGLEQAGVRVKLNMPETQIWVYASRTLMRRAIVSIATNAKQFSKNDDTIIVRLSESGKDAIIEVIDNGPGVPVSERKRIFEMFATSRPGGTGLGLFLAKMAVEKSGGVIKVFDAPSGGACFAVILPLAKRT